MYESAFLFHSTTVTRVRSQGHVKLNLNIVTKDLWKQGYRNGIKDPLPSVPHGSSAIPETAAVVDRTL